MGLTILFHVMLESVPFDQHANNISKGALMTRSEKISGQLWGSA